LVGKGGNRLPSVTPRRLVQLDTTLQVQQYTHGHGYHCLVSGGSVGVWGEG
jgi:hypothetical protein